MGNKELFKTVLFGGFQKEEVWKAFNRTYRNFPDTKGMTKKEKRIALDNAVHKEIIDALKIAASFCGKLSADVFGDDVAIPINDALKLAKEHFKGN